jgi:NAD(P)-dependent dehydrogenase (short-subunit alcohol dehydrogenase family)
LVIDEGVQALGTPDVVCANAGIFVQMGPAHTVSEQDWNDVLDVNLTGVWHTVKATVPHMIAAGRGGSIILTSSTSGVRGAPHLSAYTAAKHGVIGFMKTLVNELAEYFIRVNTVLPGGVDTDMIMNEAMYRLFLPDADSPTREDAAVARIFAAQNALPIPWAEPIDIANAVLFLASDEARYVTGTELKVDAGHTTR